MLGLAACLTLLGALLIDPVQKLFLVDEDATTNAANCRRQTIARDDVLGAFANSGDAVLIDPARFIAESRCRST